MASNPLALRLVLAALVSGTVASLVSSLALGVRGRREVSSAATPLNGPSQWVLGTHAPYRDGFSLKYTALGYAIHHLASVFWALFYEAARRRLPAHALAADATLAAGVAATASVVDFTITPRRLRPGFEKRLSTGSLVAVYVAFAAGLALSSSLRKH